VSSMLSGFDHVAVMVADTDAWIEFYGDVFGAEVVASPEFLPPGWRLTLLRLSETSEFNLFQIVDNDEAAKQTPMFGRGRLDHFGLRAASMEHFETVRDRLIARGASDGFVTDFGPVFSLFFVGPDGVEGEVCVPNPDAVPGVTNPPGTPARRFHPETA
jgi:catechol 2,3-dioxygenase-like lactoylglutathione lyase family enzyme